MNFTGIPHTRCTNCHRDPHDGSRGIRCQQCHSTKGWKQLRAGAQDIKFHQKTKFPLKGEHMAVGCATCHGPFGKKAAVFKGLKHAHCTDCHIDAHIGQLAPKAKKRGNTKVAKRDCDACHNENGFLPSLFSSDQHQQTAFPLKGAHQVIACGFCHTQKQNLARQLPQAERKKMQQRGRPVTVSLAQFRFKKPTARCESCHQSPHGTQFDKTVQAQGCNACHVEDGFAALKFDHDTDSQFPLTGQHVTADCRSCHRPDRTLLPRKARKRRPRRNQVVPIRYTPMSSQCASCHADFHYGQFASDAGGKSAPQTDCKRCHTTRSFKSAERFDHKDSRFPLKGKHRTLACSACHTQVDVAKGEQTRWYKGLPIQCAGCHVDEHLGHFSGFVP